MATLRTQFGKLMKEKASSGFKQPTARQKWITTLAVPEALSFAKTKSK